MHDCEILEIEADLMWVYVSRSLYAIQLIGSIKLALKYHGGSYLQFVIYIGGLYLNNPL